MVDLFYGQFQDVYFSGFPLEAAEIDVWQQRIAEATGGSCGPPRPIELRASLNFCEQKWRSRKRLPFLFYCRLRLYQMWALVRLARTVNPRAARLRRSPKIRACPETPNKVLPAEAGSVMREQ
jgi:hypothetical protein